MENKEAHIHKFTHINVPSTCKERGYTLHKCECGYEHKDNFKPLAPHKFEVIEETKPTCTEAGMQKLRCTVCGEIQEKPLSPLGHVWDEWMIETYATCTEDGKKFHTCKRCGTREDAIVKATGHKLVSPKKSTTEKGMLEYYCKNCGETIIVPSTGKKIKDFFTKNKKKLILSGVLAISLVVIGIGAFVANNYILPSYHYNAAKNAIKEKDYLTAYSHLNKCIGYKNSNELRDNFVVYYGTSSRGENETSRRFKYDKQGNLTHVYYYGTDGQLSSSTEFEYKYDSNGKITQVTNYDTNSDNKRELDFKSKYDYSDKGNLSKVITYEYYEGEISSETIYTYTNKGDIKSIIEYDEDDEITAKKLYDNSGNLETLFVNGETYTYNKRGNLIEFHDEEPDDIEFKRNLLSGTAEIRFYTSDGELSSKNSYDKNGNLTEGIFYTKKDGKQTVSTKRTYKYDSNNTMIFEQIQGSYMDAPIKRTYKYNKYGDTTTMERTEQDWFRSYNTNFKYDKHGILIKETQKSKVTEDGKTNKLTTKCTYSDPVVWYFPGR